MTSRNSTPDFASVSHGRCSAPPVTGCTCHCGSPEQLQPARHQLRHGSGGAVAPAPAAREQPSERNNDQPLLLLTVEQAARALGIGRTITYQLITSGALASVRIGGSRRVPTSAVHTFVADLLSATNRAVLDTAPS